MGRPGPDAQLCCTCSVQDFNYLGIEGRLAAMENEDIVDNVCDNWDAPKLTSVEPREAFFAARREGGGYQNWQWYW